MTKTSWQPSASVESLKSRAAILKATRLFFEQRNVLEVETPLLANYSVTDPHMPVFNCADRFLQTSPEYAMKRLLAAGTGDIYQISKAFRQGEQGRLHNPEFTMLEWYRTGFTDHQLMEELGEFIQLFFDEPQIGEISYGELFMMHFAVDAHTATAEELETLARDTLDVQMESDDRNDWLNLLMSECVEKDLGYQSPVIVYDYPASMAALAKLDTNGDGATVAKRFELFINGTEIANGYQELTDPKELVARFEQDNQQRREKGLPEHAIDQFLIDAHENGLPACSGVALGFDRLVMLACGVESVSEAISFDYNRA